MSEKNPLQYSQIDSALSLLKIEMSPAEAHGLMAGWLCVKPISEKGWQEKFFDDVAVSQQIEDIFYFTGGQLESMDFDFQLCLPEDEQPLQQRADALAKWCQGFLAGFGLTGFDIEKNAEIKEAIKDLSEVAKLDENDVSESEEHESMFFEVEEFVRMAVLLVYTEIQGKQQSASGAKDIVH